MLVEGECMVITLMYLFGLALQREEMFTWRLFFLFFYSWRVEVGEEGRGRGRKRKTRIRMRETKKRKGKERGAKVVMKFSEKSRIYFSPLFFFCTCGKYITF